MRELFIRKLVKMVEQSDIDSLEVSSWGRKVRIIKNSSGSNGNHSVQAVAAPQPTINVAPPPVAPAEVQPAQPAPAPPPSGHLLTAPMVGTFYRKPAPDAKAFVEVGDTVRVGQVVCIVEAMKLMNEIQSDADGTIVSIMAEDGQPVEYGQTMFEIKQS
jgi:acetyl-CoA carboxylase biotin carboxyl carrier protein